MARICFKLYGPWFRFCIIKGKKVCRLIEPLSKFWGKLHNIFGNVLVNEMFEENNYCNVDLTLCKKWYLDYVHLTHLTRAILVSALTRSSS